MQQGMPIFWVRSWAGFLEVCVGARRRIRREACSKACSMTDFNRKAHALCYMLLTPSLTVRRMNGQCESVRKCGRDIPWQVALRRASSRRVSTVTDLVLSL